MFHLVRKGRLGRSARPPRRTNLRRRADPRHSWLQRPVKRAQCADGPASNPGHSPACSGCVMTEIGALRGRNWSHATSIVSSPSCITWSAAAKRPRIWHRKFSCASIPGASIDRVRASRPGCSPSPTTWPWNCLRSRQRKPVVPLAAHDSGPLGPRPAEQLVHDTPAPGRRQKLDQQELAAVVRRALDGGLNERQAHGGSCSTNSRT